jgi:hypothetical protein
VSIDTSFYWVLPGPRSFALRIGELLAGNRMMAINLPLVTVAGTWDLVQQGIEHAHIPQVFKIMVREGTNVATDVGFQFDRPGLNGAQLANHVAHTPSAVILRSDSEAGMNLCNDYAADFCKAIDHGSGNVRLITAWHSEEYTNDVGGNGIQIVTFDGGISPDEMEAYVAVRMMSRPGPGSTRLMRAIVAEFAGFDTHFAERLMAMDPSEVLSIQTHLRKLLDETPERWRTDSWLQGTRSHATKEHHILHDQYLAEHGTQPQREAAQHRIARRYWRACVKVLTPWLEERKQKVLDIFKLHIQQRTEPDGTIAVPRGSRVAYILPDELEFNNIVGMAYGSGLNAQNSREMLALNVCKCAKSVRDEISHLRAPEPQKVIQLIQEMDVLFPV